MTQETQIKILASTLKCIFLCKAITATLSALSVLFLLTIFGYFTDSYLNIQLYLISSIGIFVITFFYQGENYINSDFVWKLGMRITEDDARKYCKKMRKDLSDRQNEINIEKKELDEELFEISNELDEIKEIEKYGL